MEAEDDDERADRLDVCVDAEIQTDNDRVDQHAKLKNMRDHRRTHAVDFQLGAEVRYEMQFPRYLSYNNENNTI